jgi:hypothetical protein
LISLYFETCNDFFLLEVIHKKRITLKTIIINISFLLSLLITACNTANDNTKGTIDKSENESKDTLIVEDDFEYMFEKLNPIRKYVIKIDSLKEWSLVLKRDIYFTAEGGEVTFYNWNGKLKKVITTEYGETFQKHSKYYLKNDTLLFAFEKVIKYNRPIYHDSITMREMGDNEVFDFDESLIIETESYFEKGKLIRSLDNQDCGAPYNEEYRNEERKRIFKEFKELKNVYNSK